MKGLELSRAFYEECGKPMLESRFPELLPYLAIGFVGKGSEHFGFDDEISQDHDYEPGFCVWIPDESVIDERTAFQLERAYAKLPKEFQGVKRLRMSPVGGNRNGVKRTSEFYSEVIGVPDGVLSTEAWLYIPDYALAEAVNGEVFLDNYGEFTRIRENLMHMPEDARRKRLAGNLLVMAQAGQYNFLRCLKHDEPAAAQLACNEFVTAAMKTVFLLHHKYMPFYKWSFRALRQMENTAELAEKLSFLLFGDLRDPQVAAMKYDAIEEISATVMDGLKKQGLTDCCGPELEAYAYCVNDKIADGNIRNLHILAAV